MVTNWEPRRLNAVAVALPETATPSGTRGRVLLAALALFAEYGFHGTSIRQLGAEAGINSATLYSHYPSKQHILAELVLIGHRELHERLQTALVDAPADPTARLCALVRAQVHAHTDFPLLALVANAELHALAPERAAPALALREQSRQLLGHVLRAGVDQGVFRLADPVLAGIAISSMGIRVANWFGPDQPYTRDDVGDQYCEYALRIVGAEQSTQNPKGEGS
ncbi:TetR/AcrR family transcriptional regulator [Stackebrandtia soli]|uniref:TetR/AcrR family transcriptional regulator n=1 Tax=Stackebrandtia soli TaxID=1892856 RepID=UPI0039E7898E